MELIYAVGVVVATVSLMFGGVGAGNEKFDIMIRNKIIEDSEIIATKASLTSLYSHLAFLTKNKKKVAVKSIEKMNSFLIFVLEKLITKERALFNRISNRLFNCLNGRRSRNPSNYEDINTLSLLKTNIEKELKEVNSKIKIIDNFFDYCPNGNCYTVVIDRGSLISNEERSGASKLEPIHESGEEEE
jgi:hypothetical protein